MSDEPIIGLPPVPPTPPALDWDALRAASPPEVFMVVIPLGDGKEARIKMGAFNLVTLCAQLLVLLPEAGLFHFIILTPDGSKILAEPSLQQMAHGLDKAINYSGRIQQFKHAMQQVAIAEQRAMQAAMSAARNGGR